MLLLLLLLLTLVTPVDSNKCKLTFNQTQTHTHTPSMVPDTLPRATMYDQSPIAASKPKQHTTTHTRSRSKDVRCAARFDRVCRGRAQDRTDDRCRFSVACFSPHHFFSGAAAGLLCVRASALWRGKAPFIAVRCAIARNGVRRFRLPQCCRVNTHLQSVADGAV